MNQDSVLLDLRVLKIWFHLLNLLVATFVICLIPLQTVLDPDQDRRYVGPDLDPNCLTL